MMIACLQERDFERYPIYRNHVAYNTIPSYHGIKRTNLSHVIDALAAGAGVGSTTVFFGKSEMYFCIFFCASSAFYIAFYIFASFAIILIHTENASTKSKSGVSPA